MKTYEITLPDGTFKAIQGTSIAVDKKTGMIAIYMDAEPAQNANDALAAIVPPNSFIKVIH
jgi:hypothetical protein